MYACYAEGNVVHCNYLQSLSFLIISLEKPTIFQSVTPKWHTYTTLSSTIEIHKICFFNDLKVSFNVKST